MRQWPTACRSHALELRREPTRGSPYFRKQPAAGAAELPAVRQDLGPGTVGRRVALAKTEAFLLRSARWLRGMSARAASSSRPLPTAPAHAWRLQQTVPSPSSHARCDLPV